MVDDPNRAKLIAHARQMVPSLREGASETERLRRLPDATDRAFREAGFYRILQPVRYGGLELDYGIHTELAAEIGRGCASSAWVLTILACHAWIFGMFPPEAQDEVWGKDPDATLATSFLPVNPTISRTGGGLNVSGRWRFSSGLDHCAACILLLLVEPEGSDGPPDPVFGLVLREDYETEDTWFVTGLAGTGSNDLVVDDFFIPEHRLLRCMELRGGPTPGSAVNPSYIYRLPMFAVFPYSLVGPAIGGARGACETVLDGLSGRQSVAQTKIAEKQSVQMRLAEASASIDAADALIARNLDEIIRQGKVGELPEMDERVRYRRDLGFAAKLCVEATEILFPLLGGRGLVADDPVGRAWRDVHAVSQHIALT